MDMNKLLKLDGVSFFINKLFQGLPIEVELLLGPDQDQKFPNNCLNISEVKKTGIDLVVGRKIEREKCGACTMTGSCFHEMVIFKPIKANKKVIGTILVTPLKYQVEWLERNYKDIEYQLDLLCKWIGVSIESQKLIEENNIFLNEINGLSAFINDLILIVAEDGEIHQLSDSLSEELGIRKSVLKGDQVTSIISKEDWKAIKVTPVTQSKKITLRTSKNKKYMARVKPLSYKGKVNTILIQLRRIDHPESSISKQKILYTFNDVKGTSKPIQEVVDIAKRVAPSNASVLIRGESGTGKEVFAQAIHQSSQRKEEPFIALNCAAIPESLLESELFGHVKGAFTGSTGDKPGRFELANGGTIFLDEIGDLSPSLQAKLLRVVQERKIERVGDTKSIPINVRIVSATNRNLEELVSQGHFREDLYYRLNVIPIILPPLRERKEDISILIEHSFNRFAQETNQSPKRISEEVYEILLSYSWPGNIRELQNVVNHFLQLEIGELITVKSLPKYLQNKHPKISVNGLTQTFLNIKEKKVEEKDLILEMLDKFGRSTTGKRKAASQLKISLSTLYRKINKYKIE